jgi:Zn-finger nucleic acid-binding protein
MQCPTCADSTLSEAERDGILIDTCPRCRGVWLDRRSLDRLLQRASSARPDQRPDTALQPRQAQAQAQAQPAAPVQPVYVEQRTVHDDSSAKWYKQRQQQPMRKKHWLAELLD